MSYLRDYVDIEMGLDYNNKLEAIVNIRLHIYDIMSVSREEAIKRMTDLALDAYNSLAKEVLDK